ALRLDRPDGAVRLDRDQIGAKISRAVLPLAKGDDPLEAVAVARVVTEKPFADIALELGAALVPVRREGREQAAERAYSGILIVTNRSSSPRRFTGSSASTG